MEKETPAFIFQKELLRAYKQTQWTKQKKYFYLNVYTYIQELCEQVFSFSYSPYPYTCFAIADPTPREILAPHFRDRILHRWIVNQLEPFVDKRLLLCSYANRTGKGHHLAMKSLHQALHHPGIQYYLKADIQSFFNSIDHHILYELVCRWINKTFLPDWKKDILRHVCAVIIRHNPTKNCVFTGDASRLQKIPPEKSYFNNPPGRGLPLGNLTSQFFANIYLHELDWYIKHHLHISYYFRYVDDFVILSENKEQVLWGRDQIKQFLKERLNMHLHPKKCMIQPISGGIDFVGYRVYRHHILVRKRVLKQCSKKMMEYHQMDSSKAIGKAEKRYWQSCFASYKGILKQANAYTHLCQLEQILTQIRGKK